MDVIENFSFTGSKVIQGGRVPFDGSERKYALYLTGVVGTRRSEGLSDVPV
jgi:hypothetical protein